MTSREIFYRSVEEFEKFSGAGQGEPLVAWSNGADTIKKYAFLLSPVTNMTNE